jgi:hypothetical protein
MSCIMPAIKYEIVKKIGVGKTPFPAFPKSKVRIYGKENKHIE